MRRLLAARAAWLNTARPEQLPPAEGNWAYVAGRGSGKTRSGAEAAARDGIQQPNTRTAIVARTFDDGRDVAVEGESGLLAVLDRYGVKHTWNRSLGELILANGSRYDLYTSEKPDQLRGPQHHKVWADEVASWIRARDTWDQMQFGLRLGPSPCWYATTTPRPTDVVRELIAEAAKVSRGSTYANAANLPDVFLRRLIAKYEGTRLGRQELHAELIEDVEGALFTVSLIDAARVATAPELKRVIVGVDPAGSSKAGSDETGIVVAGLGVDGEFYILDDVSLRGTPQQWGMEVVSAYERHTADLIVAEENFGAEMVKHVVHGIDPHAPYHKERGQAGLGKQVRAEPISALYERGLVHHVGAPFPHLEDQMCSWTQDSRSSPDRLDALVWAVRTLMKKPGARITHAGRAR